MSYVSAIYATVAEFESLTLGLSAAQIALLPVNIVARFTQYVVEGNNQVEGKLSKYSDLTPLTANSDAFTFAKNASLNWAMYKNRQFLGSANAKDSLADFNSEITSMENILIKTRGDRTVNVSILGESQKNTRIILPSQIDTFYY